MFPNLFSLVSANAGVQAQFGTNPVRVFLFGQAPPNPMKSYAVWQVVFGGPENFLNQLPQEDRFGVQIDVYATSATAARNGAQALRDALETHAHITSWRGESRDTETTNYRVSFDLEFFTER